MKRVLKYLKGTSNYFLRLSNVNAEHGILNGYADANWAEDRFDRKSNSGYVFQLNGGTISWACRKQTCVSLSSTEAEFVALSEACKEVIWLRRLLHDMRYSQTSPTVIFEDNQSCLRLIKEEKLSNRTKHIDTKVHFVKDHIERKDIICVYCPSEKMVADMMTKPLAASTFEKFRKSVGVEID